MVPPTTPWFTAVNAMFITGGLAAPNPVLYWIESGNLLGAALVPTAASPSGSGSPSGSTLPLVSPLPNQSTR
jgi:hypothetical protein